MVDFFAARPAMGDVSTLRVDTLARVRWLAVVGQTAALLFAALVLGVDLPVFACLLFVALSASLNIALRLRYRLSYRLPLAPATALLGYDILQLAALLYLTGGLQNPFTLLFLAPIAISATSLPLRNTALLYLLMIAAAGAMAALNRPMPWLWGATIELAPAYKATIWLSLAISAAFVAGYASRVATETQQLSDALAATDLALARQQHLSQLDGLAAAAAHELGTPLGTIRLVVKEWQRNLAEPPTEEDVRLVAQEAERCRAILAKLSTLRADSMHERLSVAQLAEEAVGPHRQAGVAVVLDIDGEGGPPVLRRNPGLSYGLGNLVENAVDFARSEVRLTVRWTRRKLTLVVADDGPGFPSAILQQVGDPYLRSARQGRRTKTEGGLGLGLFISKTLLERSGAVFALRNAPGGGAVATLSWDRESIEAPSEIER
ncbi:MAG: ActS/PrrB/RegB family redox-sensitive histidine kinase [Methylobacteriaceae bacterium]|nr:ActS/PrrB/RegB family redox-sensitive histidine kinase [Methylobacteriaceae bacterium]